MKNESPWRRDYGHRFNHNQVRYRVCGTPSAPVVHCMRGDPPTRVEAPEVISMAVAEMLNLPAKRLVGLETIGQQHRTS